MIEDNSAQNKSGKIKSLPTISGPPVNCKGKIKEGKIFFVLKLFNSH